MMQALRNLPHKAKTAGVVVSAAGMIAYNMLLLPWEGNKLTPYLDVGGVPTACMGITGPEITKAWKEGRIFTEAECHALNVEAVAKHEKRVNQAITHEAVTDITRASFISFDFNTGAIFTSTLRKKANAGDIVGACNELSRWVFVKGQVISGLQNRRYLGSTDRISERTLCLIGIDPTYKTPLFEALWGKYGWGDA